MKHVWIVRLNDSILTVKATRDGALNYMKSHRERNREQLEWEQINEDRWRTPHAIHTLWIEVWTVSR